LWHVRSRYRYQRFQSNSQFFPRFQLPLTMAAPRSLETASATTHHRQCCRSPWYRNDCRHSSATSTTTLCRISRQTITPSFQTPHARSTSSHGTFLCLSLHRQLDRHSSLSHHADTGYTTDASSTPLHRRTAMGGTNAPRAGCRSSSGRSSSRSRSLHVPASSWKNESGILPIAL
jgi:hypothetical protein